VDCTLPYETLSKFAAGELDPTHRAEVERHVAACPHCRTRLDTLRQLDTDLGQLRRTEPPARTVLNTRRLLSHALRRNREPELMTLDEVAAFLRISLDDLEQIVLELPAFELAGHLRVRRTRLLEWLDARARAWTRSTTESEVARILADQA